MTRHMRNRLKRGLLWKTDKEPLPPLNYWLIGCIVTLIFLLLISILDGQYAKAETVKAVINQDKAERNLVAMMNGRPLIGDDGVLVSARVEFIDIKSVDTE